MGWGDDRQGLVNITGERVDVAQASEGLPNRGAPLQVLVCETAEHRVALPFTSIVEIVQAVTVTPLPGAPPIVDGVINVRGAVVPVADLGARLGAASGSVKPSQHMVLARAGARMVALRVERAADLLQVPPSNLTASSELRGAAPYIRGAVALPDGLLLLCDLEAFLSEPECAALDDALASHFDPTGQS